jgi:hypothetical protein
LDIAAAGDGRAPQAAHASVSWTAAGSAAPRRFRPPDPDGILNAPRPPESGVAAPALPPHSKTLRAIRRSSENAPASWTAVALHRFSTNVKGFSFHNVFASVKNFIKKTTPAAAASRRTRHTRSAAFTPLQLTLTSTHRKFPTLSPVRTLKRAEARAPARKIRASVSWTAAGSAAPRRFRPHDTDEIFNALRPPKSGVAAPALPPHSMTLLFQSRVNQFAVGAPRRQ